jgi:hypothetical protein
MHAEKPPIIIIQKEQREMAEDKEKVEQEVEQPEEPERLPVGNRPEQPNPHDASEAQTQTETDPGTPGGSPDPGK